MKARQISIVTKQITNGTIFPNISAKIRQGVVTLIDHEFSKLKREVDDSFDLIRSDIDIVVAEKPQPRNEAIGVEAKRLTERLAKRLAGIQMKHDKILRIQWDIVGA